MILQSISSVAQNQFMHKNLHLGLQHTSVYFLCVCLAQAKGFISLSSCFASATRLWSKNTTTLIKVIVFTFSEQYSEPKYAYT